jgi:arsenite-transporting ATPase
LTGLKVSKIDPKVETQNYVDKILKTKGSKLIQEEKDLMIEDLRSPCTEEVAVFHAFSKIVSEAQSSFVVLDTAPTGHSLLLMDATGAYHRQAIRDLKKAGITKVMTPLMRLQDANYTKIILVTLPEATPVSQAAALQEDLRRAQVEPFAWVMNKSLFASGTIDPVLTARMRSEQKQFERVRSGLAKKIFVLPWQVTPPIGISELSKLVKR